MKIHKETISSELQLLMDGVNSKEQTVEEIVAYIRWRDKQLTIPAVVGQIEQFICPCCGSDKTYKTDAYHCNRCAVTTEV